MSRRVARSRELVAEGYPTATTARVMQISRQAIYRTPRPRRAPQRRPVSCPVERAIVETARENPTDGYRMVWAICRRKLGCAINRKRVLRVMREQRLIQRRRREPKRRRPGFFRVERPDQLWHLDMTAVWVAEHGWCYLMAAIDCCTREIVGFELSLRCRALEAVELIEGAARSRAIEPGQLVLGTDNGSQFTARRTRMVMSGLGIAHRRGGYRDPSRRRSSSRGFRSSRSARSGATSTRRSSRPALGGYVERYHDRPHSSLDYRTPKEVAETWEDGQALSKQAA